MLQTASPDAIMRLENTELADEKREIERIYFKKQHHNSIEDFLINHVHSLVGLLMQVCYRIKYKHSHVAVPFRVSHAQLQGQY